MARMARRRLRVVEVWHKTCERYQPAEYRGSQGGRGWGDPMESIKLLVGLTVPYTDCTAVYSTGHSTLGLTFVMR